MVSVTVGGVGNAPRGRSKVKGSWTLGKSVSVSLNLSWFGYQGPRGLPGERGRPGPPGAAVSIPGPLGTPGLWLGFPPRTVGTGHNWVFPLSFRVLVVMMVLLVQLGPL